MFSFSGRIGRGQFWGATIAGAVLTIIGLAMQGASTPNEPGLLVMSLVLLIPAIWFLLAAVVKRTRDIWPDSVGMVWMMLILSLLPLAGLVVTLILGVQPGAKARPSFNNDHNDVPYTGMARGGYQPATDRYGQPVPPQHYRPAGQPMAEDQAPTRQIPVVSRPKIDPR